MSDKIEQGIVVVLRTPEDLSLIKLADDHGYSRPMRSTPWMEKAYGSLQARITRDNERKRWSVRLVGDITDWSAIKTGLTGVFEDFAAIGADVHALTVLVRLNGVLEPMPEDAGYEKIESRVVKTMANGALISIQEKEACVLANISRPMDDAGDVLFLVDNLYYDLAKIGLVKEQLAVA